MTKKINNKHFSKDLETIETIFEKYDISCLMYSPHFGIADYQSSKSSFLSLSSYFDCYSKELEKTKLEELKTLYENSQKSQLSITKQNRSYIS